MLRPRLQSIARSPSFIFAILTIIAIISFVAVTRLVNRYGEQEKALARRMYARGLAEQKDGRPERALEDFRAALLYDQNNFQYQLSLARALRDSGRTDEAETYLVTLWEANPQDGAVNLALGRLAARENLVDNAIHYYHNAIYGVWPPNAGNIRRDAEFELVDFLVKSEAFPQAQAELITMTAANPEDVETQIRIANSFLKIRDYEHALSGFQSVWNRNRNNAEAAAGAGQAAFALRRYGLAESYLNPAADLNSSDAQSRDLLHMTKMVLESDPFLGRTSQSERLRRTRTDFAQAGLRLNACAAQEDLDLTQPGENPQAKAMNGLASQWLRMKPELKSSADDDTFNQAIDLIGKIEQETGKQCGSGSAIDQALLLVSQGRTNADAGADQ